MQCHTSLLVAASVALLAAAFSRANDTTKEDRSAPPETVEQILGAPLPDEAYAQGERCLALHEYQTVRVLSEQVVVFEGRRGRYWLNQLHGKCIGLRGDLVLKFNLHNAQVCDLDTFRGLDNTGLNPLLGSGNCTLGRFEPVSKPQLDLLKSAIRMRRSSPAVDRTERAEKEAQQDAS
jgi:hypothetical protein